MPYGRQTTDSPERMLYAKALCGFVRESLLEYLDQPGLPPHYKKVCVGGGGGEGRRVFCDMGVWGGRGWARWVWCVEGRVGFTIALHPPHSSPLAPHPAPLTPRSSL